MQEYNWTYDDYMNTPKRIIDLIIAKSNIDSKLKK
jgi:hypothetical protein